MIVIIDYGMGNAASILNMIRRMGGEATISSKHDLITQATALILPGVGSFDNAVDKLNSSNLIPLIKHRVLNDRIPFFGVCLGMQLLFDSSEEGERRGLGLIPGTVKRFNFEHLSDTTLKIPHMGWNLVYPKEGGALFSGLESEPRFYFVHSYHVVCDNPTHEIATSVYGYRFTCGVQRDNIYAVQFHPEKSHKFGMQMFKNFLELVC